MTNVKEKLPGVKGVHHGVIFDYKTWGLANMGLNEAITVKKTQEMDAANVAKYIKIFEQLLDLTGYKLVNSKYVPHYCGEDYPLLTLAWLRFEREDQINAGVCGEHISVTFEQNTDKLMGMVRMVPKLDDSCFVSHQHALETTIKFLRQNAPDLISREVVIPQLAQLDNGSHIMFDPEDKRLCFDKVQVYWINDHKELVTLYGKQEEVHGMKVKMYIPEQKLYIWVIVDKNNEVVVFERSINWDFVKGRRNTQMWLQDHWLLAQKINDIIGHCNPDSLDENNFATV